MTWQVHLYGSAKAELKSWCAARRMPLHVYDWTSAHEKAGLARDAIYLIRPDTYVALAERSGSPAALDAYFADRRIDLGSAEALGPPRPRAGSGEAV